MELGIDQFGSVELGLPGFGGRVEVRARHTEGHGQPPVLRLGPGEGTVLHYVGQLGLVGEEEGQVRGEDTILHGLENFLVFLGVEG